MLISAFIRKYMAAFKEHHCYLVFAALESEDSKHNAHERQKIDSAAMLKSMDLEGLKGLRKKLDRAIASYETRRRQEALYALELAAKEHGFKLAELLGEGKSGRGRRLTDDAAKYVNSDNSEQTRSGRGRRPQWVNDALKAGRTLDELAA